MKLNRITSLVAFALALLVVCAQFIGSVHAAPPSQISAVSVQFAPGAVGARASVSQPASPADQTPYHLTVQGRLTDPNGNPITVATNITFKLYNFATGGSPLYTEGPVSVTPSSNGLFTYLLGSNTTWTAYDTGLFANKIYLGVTVASDAEMTPRFEMTGSPYAYSLAPGATVAGATNSSSTPVLSVIATGGTVSSAEAGYFANTNGGSGNRTGLAAVVGGIGTSGASSSAAASFLNEGGGTGNGGQFGMESTLQGSIVGAGYGGFFQNQTFNTTATQYGLFSLTYTGSGVHAISDNSTNSQQSAGVVGVSLASGSDRGVGGVFTGTLGAVGYATGDTALVSGYNDGVSGLTSAPGGSGLYGHSTGSGGEGVWGTALLGPSSDVGGFFDSYDEGASHTAIYARGAGHSTGGWFSPNGFGLMVKYDGTGDLHPGDVLALDGNNPMVEGSQVLGVVKADASNADAAIGIAQYRYQVYPAADKSNPMSHDSIQVDDKATAIKSGDLMQIIIAGQAQVKVSGNVKVGDRLAISSDGSVAAAKDGLTIGKVAGKPDANGLVTVVVNFK